MPTPDLAALHRERRRLDREIARATPPVMATCKACHTATPIADLEFIQTHWYVTPYSCTGGDYWRAGKGQWACGCGYLNRIVDGGEYTPWRTDPLLHRKRQFRSVQHLRGIIAPTCFAVRWR